jgi:hypothetical protein
MVSDSQRVAQQRGHDRRTQRTPLYYPERRSGFDRRTPRGWRGRYLTDLRGYAARPRTVVLVLATIVVFNFLDFFLTMRVLQLGGVELNPIMDHLFDIGPRSAAIAKLGSAGIVALVLLAMRRYRRTLEVSLALLVAYSALMFYHVVVAISIPT